VRLADQYDVAGFESQELADVGDQSIDGADQIRGAGAAAEVAVDRDSNLFRNPIGYFRADDSKSIAATLPYCGTKVGFMRDAYVVHCYIAAADHDADGAGHLQFFRISRHSNRGAVGVPCVPRPEIEYRCDGQLAREALEFRAKIQGNAIDRAATRRHPI
jgi:hypothetical protein